MLEKKNRWRGGGGKLSGSDGDEEQVGMDDVDVFMLQDKTWPHGSFQD